MTDVIAQAASNVSAYINERGAFRGLDPEDIAVANLFPLRVSDLKILIAAASRVSDDPATVERVAKAMTNCDGKDWWSETNEKTREGMRLEARAAIAALKENNDA